MPLNLNMSELDDTETYAAAALFTLALYSSQVQSLINSIHTSDPVVTQVEVGVDRFQETLLGEYRASAWG